MRRNDFFKSLLFSGGSAASRSELETETLPYTFYTQPKTLKNYRIYGNTVNGESVGDRTRNLLDIEHPEIKKFDIEKVSFGVYTAKSDMAYNANRYRLNTETGKTYRLTGKIPNNKLVQLSGILPGTINPENGEIVKSGNISTIFIAQGLTTLSIYSSIADNTLFTVAELQVIEGSTALPYEPYGYRVPVTVTNGVDTQTTNLYLPEQIKMVGDEAEYIDFREQKQHFADGTSADVTLPAIPILFNTNTLSVGTTVQPSKIWIQGNVSEILPVSASLNSIPQSLRMIDLSKDKVSEPENEDLQLDIVPVEKYVINLKDSEKTIEPTKVERGVESAE